MAVPSTIHRMRQRRALDRAPASRRRRRHGDGGQGGASRPLHLLRHVGIVAQPLFHQFPGVGVGLSGQIDRQQPDDVGCDVMGLPSRRGRAGRQHRPATVCGDHPRRRRRPERHGIPVREPPSARSERPPGDSGRPASASMTSAAGRRRRARVRDGGDICRPGAVAARPPLMLEDRSGRWRRDTRARRDRRARVVHARAKPRRPCRQPARGPRQVDGKRRRSCA